MLFYTQTSFNRSLQFALPILLAKRAKDEILRELRIACNSNLRIQARSDLIQYSGIPTKVSTLRTIGKSGQNSRDFCQKSFFSLVRKIFPHTWGDVCSKQTNLPHPKKTQKLDKSCYHLHHTDRNKLYQYKLWRSTSMVTDFGSPEVDKNGNISVYRLLFFLMMVSIDRSRRALSIDILIAKN